LKQNIVNRGTKIPKSHHFSHFDHNFLPHLTLANIILQFSPLSVAATPITGRSTKSPAKLTIEPADTLNGQPFFFQCY